MLRPIPGLPVEDYISYWAKNVDGEERKTPTRILEEPAQPSFLPSVNSYRLFLLQVHGRTHFFEFLCACHLKRSEIAIRALR